MHPFSELIQRSTIFTLDALASAEQRSIDELQSSAPTSSIKALQMVQLQKVISAVGMFSIFDAILQDEKQCASGFQRAEELLEMVGEHSLKERFSDLQLAVNVLKHGKGRSYDALHARASLLPFKLKLPDQGYFCEGDVAEVLTLIEVDDAFVKMISEVIHDVSKAIQSIDQNGA